ncbi:MAG: hypothetical protein FJZ04_03305 [Candidatus Moranbacteria bacterium]|nr:hypothetical protein [Candidatus Moranbacteria bacterium]
MSSITFYKQSPEITRRKRRRHYRLPPLRVGPATMGIITLFIILLMSLLYLIQANSTATKGYEIEKEQERIKKLESQAEKLELEMAKLRSTKELDEIPQKLNLIPLPADELSVIQVIDKAAALADAKEDKEERNPKR